MLQQNGLNENMPRKNMDELSPAIAAEPDDADGDHMINYSLL
jgi:hypothetical protein